MNGILLQLFQNTLVVLIAPLLLGWVNQCRAWLQNRSGAGVLQPYRNLVKLFHKDAVLANNASPLFRFTPILQHVAGGGMVPVITADALSPAVDVIALVVSSRWRGCSSRSRQWISALVWHAGRAP